MITGSSHDSVAVCDPWVPGVSARSCKMGPSCPQSVGAYFETICMYFTLMHFHPLMFFLALLHLLLEAAKKSRKKRRKEKDVQLDLCRTIPIAALFV